MAKKSIVKKVDFQKTWKNKEGKVFYSYDVEMENGDKGEYSSISDSQEKFVKGDEVEYNYTEGEYPKIKPYYSNPTSPNYTYTSKPDSTDNQIARSVGLKAATELGIAQGLELVEILETAKIMADFITTEKVIEVSKESDKMPF
mgnify:CR=1 FL=1|tara:strand:+ start:636 stop:1067 length:432 start_codon:yes stop_codon:yes gene_type:complete